MNTPVELQTHFISLIADAVQAAGGFCRLVIPRPTAGVMYVSRAATVTVADYSIAYSFSVGGDGPDIFLQVTFSDSRPTVTYSASYWQGIDDFFPLFAKALSANRLPSAASYRVTCLTNDDERVDATSRRFSTASQAAAYAATVAQSRKPRVELIAEAA